MRADRLVSLILLLQNRGRMTADRLAAELEVSVRTVYRDVEALGTAGVPVIADRGPEGGYRLMEGYRTRLTGLTGAEADSLFLLGAPSAARDLGLDAVLATARHKLRAALPAPLAERAERVRDRFHLDAPGWFRDAEEVPLLAEVTEGVWERRVLRVLYRRRNTEVERELWPLGVVLKGGTWYLVASVEAGDERAVRTYRVSRLSSVETTGEVFARPTGFDLVSYWEESARRLEGSVLRGRARLRISPRERDLLPMRFGAVGVRALKGAGPPDERGWVEVEMEVETLAVAVGDLLRMGTGAEVLGPEELRRAVADEVAALGRLYEGRDRGGGGDRGGPVWLREMSGSSGLA
ncbi:WYL domain-containing protein [Nocardiopsis alba]|uniref:helix-turn-helix transcriptional regulator n=2 Tax=Nocardiopsis alba TaxID=53437 RepID=UPI0033FE30AA